eukprot:8749930-Alexandrium_andersonii.AAC.1
MSASLVGSEMCIRDSSSAEQRAAPQRGHLRHAAQPGSPFTTPTPATGSICLLYTSDAADDM